jgi:hypothetical protein
MGRGFPANTSGPPPANSSSWLGTATGLATGDRPGYCVTNVLSALPPTALRFIRSALSFPRIPRQSDSTRWSWGTGIRYATVNCSSAAQVSRAVRRGLPVRVPAGLATSLAGSSCWLFVLHCASCESSLTGVAHFVFDAVPGSTAAIQRLHGRRFSFLTTGFAGTSLGHVELCKERWRLSLSARSDTSELAFIKACL